MLNFSTPFKTSTDFNQSSIFTTLSKASGGGAANNIGPQYYDGAMFANDYEWYTYGGKLRTTDQFKAPAGNAVASYQVYPSGPPKDFNKGFILDTLPEGITRYVTNGAAVSVPSENLGYYFDEWYTYGGKLRTTDQFKAPAGNAVASYQVYPSGPPKDFNKGFILDTLPEGITRYVTNGAAVSVPSENLGYYFAGLRSASYGPIFNLPGPRNQSVSADQLSTTLIEINMAKQGGETWKNSTLPTSVPGRANPEIVWVPVAEKGILVAIGGVIFPAYVNVNQSSSAAATAQSVRVLLPTPYPLADNETGRTEPSLHVYRLRL